MRFDLYLDFFDREIRNNGDIKDAIFNGADQVSKPSQEQLLSFLTKMQTAFAVETKKSGQQKDAVQVDKRQKAIGQIITFVQQQGSPCAFGGIDKLVFAFQLALRARSPRIINQDRTTLCGPVAIIFDIAKRDPERYVKFAISLFTTGSGMLGSTQVTPSSTIRNGFRRDLLPEADYVVLASLRDTDAIVLSNEVIRNILTLTKPGAVCEFLTRAGYTDVRDHTFFNLSTPLRVLNAVTPFGLHGTNHNPLDKAAQNLAQAERESFSGQRLIILNADGEVAQSIVGGTTLTVRPDPLPADATHWTAVRRLGILGNTVQLKIVTWGGSYHASVPKDALLSRYAGYISARM